MTSVSPCGGECEHFSAQIQGRLAYLPPTTFDSNLEWVQSAVCAISFALKSQLGIVFTTDERLRNLNVAHEFDGGYVAVLTSGTSGDPKVRILDLRERYEQLLKKPARASREEFSWLLTYQPDRWASISMIIFCLATSSSIVAPPSLHPQEILETARSSGATALAITPSRFRSLIIADSSALKECRFQSISFGGEWADQALLDSTRAIFPKAKISHVLSSTETGDVISVSDGLAGYPKSELLARGVEFGEDGEMFVRGTATGDLWRLESQRYHFLGRKDDCINIGGLKVWPAEIEKVALELSSVTAARAYGIRSSIIGEVVGLDLIADNEHYASIVAHLRTVLPKYSWPARLRLVENFYLNDAGKVSRKVSEI